MSALITTKNKGQTLTPKTSFCIVKLRKSRLIFRSEIWTVRRAQLKIACRKSLDSYENVQTMAALYLFHHHNKKKSMRAHNILQTTSLFCQIVCDRDTKSYPPGQKAHPVLSYLWRSGRLGNWSSIDRQCHGNDRPSDLCRLVHHSDKWSLFIVRVQVIWGPWSRFTIYQDTTGAYPEIK